ERFPGQIEAVELRVAALERGDDAQRLRVVVEAAMLLETLVERALAGVTERRMTEIVPERGRLRQVLVETERARQRPRDLGYFQGMRQPCAEMIALVIDEHLRLVRQAAEGGGMDDAVAVAAKIVARGARRLGVAPPAALHGIGGVGSARDLRRNCHRRRPGKRLF